MVSLTWMLFCVKFNNYCCDVKQVGILSADIFHSFNKELYMWSEEKWYVALKKFRKKNDSV